MRIDIWSDIVCPWCFIGKRRLEAALSNFDGNADIHWHSFELDPNAAKSLDMPLADALAKKYGMTRERAMQTASRCASTSLRLATPWTPTASFTLPTRAT
jgi:predicted DsbA family dithiol-disulfide isomerase